MKIFKSGGEIMMEYINIFGAIFMVIIMIPNIIYAIKNKDAFENKWTNKTVEILEQVGRIGCFGFTVFNIPGTWFGWWSDEAFAFYLIINTVLVILYCLTWMIDFKKQPLLRAVLLSVLPSTFPSTAIPRTPLLPAASSVTMRFPR